MTQRGKFITVEGPDGAGKTTNVSTIKSCVEQRGIELVCTREPGGTPLGEQVRLMLLEQHELSISPMAQTLLIFAARAQHITEVIEPALARGAWVLCDRFTDATHAYQGGGHGIDTACIDTLAAWVHKDQSPDVTLIFDVTVEVGVERLGCDAADRFETQVASFKQRVRQTYRTLAHSEPERVHLFSTERERESVASDVTSLINNYIDGVLG